MTDGFSTCDAQFGFTFANDHLLERVGLRQRRNAERRNVVCSAGQGGQID